MKQPTKKQIEQMTSYAYARGQTIFVEEECEEIDMTNLAEDIAHNSPAGDFDHLLDEEQGIVWQIAFEVCEYYESGMYLEDL